MSPDEKRYRGEHVKSVYHRNQKGNLPKEEQRLIRTAQNPSTPPVERKKAKRKLVRKYNWGWAKANRLDTWNTDGNR